MKDTLLVVLGELAVLLPALFVASFVSGFMVNMACAKKDRARLIDLPAIAAALETFHRKKGHYPDKLHALVGANIIEKIPTDPWDREYLYEKRGEVVRLASFGKDGSSGGEDHDRDVECWPGQGHTCDANQLSCPGRE